MRLRRAYQTMLPVDLPQAARPGKRIDREGPIQRACVNWLRWQYPHDIIHHSPNERLGRGKDAAREVAKHKFNGMVPGFPDILWLHGGRPYLIECKAGKNGLTDEQIAVRDLATKQGIPFTMVRSLDELRAWVGEVLED